MMPTALEEQRKRALTAEWEGLCRADQGCKTACCYYEGSACENLKIVDNKTGAGVCSVYDLRFGLHKNLEGQTFRCVPFRTYLQHHPAVEGCGYKVVLSIEGVPVVRGKP